MGTIVGYRSRKSQIFPARAFGARGALELGRTQKVSFSSACFSSSLIFALVRTGSNAREVQFFRPSRGKWRASFGVSFGRNRSRRSHFSARTFGARINTVSFVLKVRTNCTRVAYLRCRFHVAAHTSAICNFFIIFTVHNVYVFNLTSLCIDHVAITRPCLRSLLLETLA